MGITKITSIEEFQQEIIERKYRKVIVEFTTNWSGESYIMRNTLTYLAEKYSGEVNFYIVDGDNNLELIERFGIHKFPTLVFFDAGEPLDCIIGITSRVEITKKIEKFIYKQIW